jgi:type IV pilus biogenesis protein CpaD/CtpE
MYFVYSSGFRCDSFSHGAGAASASRPSVSKLIPSHLNTNTRVSSFKNTRRGGKRVAAIRSLTQLQMKLGELVTHPVNAPARRLSRSEAAALHARASEWQQRARSPTIAGGGLDAAAAAAAAEGVGRVASTGADSGQVVDSEGSEEGAGLQEASGGGHEEVGGLADVSLQVPQKES